MNNILDTPAGIILAVGIAMAAIIFASFSFSGPEPHQVERCSKIENIDKSVACFEAINR